MTTRDTPITPVTAWAPPSGLDIVIQPAGVWWDAVKVPAHVGDRALARLGDGSGAVIRDGWSGHLYWLVRKGTAEGWALPPIAVLSVACYVAVPPVHRTAGPGPHWAVAPAGERRLGDGAAVYEALAYALGAALGLHAGSAP